MAKRKSRRTAGKPKEPSRSQTTPALVKRWWTTAGKDLRSLFLETGPSQGYEHLCDLLIAYAGVLSKKADIRNERPPKASKKRKKKPKPPLSEKTLAALCANLAREATELKIALSAVQSIHLLDKACKGRLVHNFLDENEKEQAVQGLCQTAVSDIEGALARGEVRRVRMLLEFCESNLPEVHRNAIENLKSISSEAIAKLPPEAKALIMSQQPKQEKPLYITFADESQKGSVGQIALVLLKAWTAKSDGEKSQEAFEVLEQYARVYNRVSLFGKAGESVAYNSQSFYGHDLQEGEQAEIIRPGAQVTTDDGPKILIPATVRRAGNEI